MNKAVVYIGVDVAKASLDVAWAERSRRFANNKSGLSALTKWVKQSPDLSSKTRTGLFVV